MMNAALATKALPVRGNVRRLILIDIENYNGQPIRSSAQVKWCKKMLVRWLDIKDGEIVVIASDKGAVLNVNAGWKGSRALMGTGPSGADLRLVEEIESMNPGRFDQIALVSGDGIFAEPVARAAELGVPTAVYSHGFQLSHKLRLAAAEVHIAEDGYDRSSIAPASIPATAANVIQFRSNTEETA